MFKSLPKSKYPTEMLHVLPENTLNLCVQFILGFNRKTWSLQEKSFENDLEHFVSDSIFKRLNFDYSSLETVSNQPIISRAIFLETLYSWRLD